MEIGIALPLIPALVALDFVGQFVDIAGLVREMGGQENTGLVDGVNDAR